MVKIYFDSSAYVKYFDITEDGSSEVRKIIDYAEKHNNIQIIMSVWAINETIAAIDQKAYKKTEITKEDAHILIANVLQKTNEYLNNESSNILITAVNNELVKDSSTFIYASHLSADDALHVLTASDQGCQYLITSDGKIRKELPTTIHGISEKIRMDVLDISKENDIDYLIKNLDKM